MKNKLKVGEFYTVNHNGEDTVGKIIEDEIGTWILLIGERIPYPLSCFKEFYGPINLGVVEHSVK